MNHYFIANLLPTVTTVSAKEFLMSVNSWWRRHKNYHTMCNFTILNGR